MPTDTNEQKIEGQTDLNKDMAKIEVSGDTPLPDEQPVTQPHFTHPLKTKKSFKERLRALLRSKKFWIITVLVLLVAALTTWFIEPSRYWLVNTLGQRTTLTVIAVSPGEGQSKETVKLKNVVVTVDGREFTTDDQGKVTVDNQRFGLVKISTAKAGFANAEREVTLDYDPFFHAFGGKQNDADARNVQLEMASVGITVSFTAIDYLSSQPISTGEFKAGDLTIKPTEAGLVEFKAPANDANKVSVASHFGGAYLDKTFELELGKTDSQQMVFVPAGRHYFMSNRDGALGIYGVNIDGSEPQQIIPGTGREQADTLFSVNASGTLGVLASTRDGVRDAARQQIVRLYIVDLAKKQLTKVDEGYGFGFIGWSGDTLVYRNTIAMAPKNEESVRLLDTNAKQQSTLAAAPATGPGVVALDQLVITIYEDADKNGQLEFTAKRFDLKTKAQRDLLQNAQSVVQTAFDRVAVSGAGNVWKEYNLNTGALNDIAPPGESTRYYSNVISPDGSKRLVVDKIDGKFVLLTRNASDGAEKRVFSQGDLTGPLQWLGNNVVVFRVASSSETADYALSLNGGEPKKISDVTSSQYQYNYFNGFRSY